MTITTAGAIKIKHMLPNEKTRSGFNIHTTLNKKEMSKLVNNLVQNGGEHSHDVVNNLSKLFFNKATEIGSTTPLSDYINESDERQTTLSEFEHKVGEILKKDLPKHEQHKALLEMAGPYAEKLEKANLEYMLERGSTAAKMASIGARGNASQLAQGTSSPMMSKDVKGNPLPIAIMHSYAEGLTPAEHLAASYGGRASTVMSQLSTEKPGALFKKLTPAVFHEVITINDCHTTNGIPLPLTDKLSCIGRFEAGSNKEITPEYLKDLVNSGKKTVTARNPMTCTAKEGLCQKCYGISANGHLPAIGQNVGVIASQSVSEVLTQAMLSTKHQGGVVGKFQNPYEAANTLLTNPENFVNEATTAKENGRVTKINQTSLKDWEVHIGNTVHFIPNIQDPIVKVGDVVRIGDPLSTGTINPRELVELKGSGAGRIHIANKMREIYSRNAQLDPRHFDVIARNMIKHNVVTDPGDSGFMPGDKIEVAALGEHLARHSIEVPLSAGLGQTLAKPLMDLTPGTSLTQNHLDDLAGQGVKNLWVSNSTLRTKPLVPGLQSLKGLDKNWVSKLSFNQLTKTITEAGALGQNSKIHSTDPVTGYMMGSEFGEGDGGRY
jgi:DNA-directed RNA polymerase subunit beta'